MGVKFFPFVVGIIAAFVFTVYISFFTSVIGIGPFLTFPEKVVKGLQIVLLLMVSMLFFTIPALFLNARKEGKSMFGPEE